MKTRVFDSWPWIEWLYGRLPAAEWVDRALDAANEGEARLVMSAINCGEVYYFLRKNGKEQQAEWWNANYETLPVTVEVPTMDEIWNAARLKGCYPVSYADAFAASLAQKYKCPVVTGDREFLCVDGLQVEWIGRQA